MLITLTLALTMLTIALLTVLPDMTQQIRRDREEEMIHRGTAYMRAIQHFYRTFGRYPSRIEDLENTNNHCFLRKRYTDPLNRDPATGKEKDFEFLYQTDILGQTSGLNGLGGQGGVPPQSGLQGQGGFSGATSGDPAAAAVIPVTHPRAAQATHRMRWEIRVRSDRRLRIPIQVPIPARPSTSRPLGERSWGSPAPARRGRFASSTTKPVTRTGSSSTCRRLIGEAC